MHLVDAMGFDQRLSVPRQARQDHAKAAKPLASLARLAFQACEPGTALGDEGWGLGFERSGRAFRCKADPAPVAVDRRGGE